MSIHIKLKINTYPLNYIPDDLPISKSEIIFSNKINKCPPIHEYPRYKSLNLFEHVSLYTIFESYLSFRRNNKQLLNSLTLHSYIEEYNYYHTIYNNLFQSLKGKIASICNSDYDYIYEEEVNLCYEYVVDNLFILLTQYIEYITKSKEISANSYSAKAFGQFVKHLVPSNNILYTNTKYPTLTKFKLHMYYSDKKYKEVRSNVPPFIPAGSCDTFHKEIFLNTHHWNYYGTYGSSVRLRLFYHTYLHELGHAVDFPRENIQLFNQMTLSPREREVSQYPAFLKYVKQSYLNKKKVKTKKNGYLSYYMCPQFQVNNQVTKKKNLISINWYRASQEAFAESFGYLCYWYLNGIGKADILFIDGHIHKNLIVIKTLIPVLKLLNFQLNWELIGIPKNLITKRKKMIMAYLQYVEYLDYQPRNSNVKSRRSNDVKKPTLQKLLRKKLK